MLRIDLGHGGLNVGEERSRVVAPDGHLHAAAHGPRVFRLDERPLAELIVDPTELQLVDDADDGPPGSALAESEALSDGRLPGEERAGEVHVDHDVPLLPVTMP